MCEVGNDKTVGVRFLALDSHAVTANSVWVENGFCVYAHVDLVVLSLEQAARLSCGCVDVVDKAIWILSVSCIGTGKYVCYIRVGSAIAWTSNLLSQLEASYVSSRLYDAWKSEPLDDGDGESQCPGPAGNAVTPFQRRTRDARVDLRDMVALLKGKRRD
jgi:hypothetical protein